MDNCNLDLGSHLRIGDLYLISPAMMSRSFRPDKVPSNTVLEQIAFYRTDGRTGNYAARPYMAVQLHEALIETSHALERCRNIELKSFAKLLHVVATVERLSHRQIPAGAYDDIIIALQPESLNQLVKHTQNDHSHEVEHLRQEMDRFGVNDPTGRYGYLLNVVAHNFFRQCGELGFDDTRTELVTELDPVKINIIVASETPEDKILIESGEDILIPVIETWFEKLTRYEYCSGKLHLDPRLLDRFTDLRLPKQSIALLTDQVEPIADVL